MDWPLRENGERQIRDDTKMITMLLLISVALFTVLYLAKDAFQKHRDQLAVEWFERGKSEMNAGRPVDAASDFRTALSYAPDKRAYVLSLAQALAKAGHNTEASSYLESLLQEEPGDGEVNLELARIAARNHDFTAAMRYFHSAIYGAWAEDGQTKRRQARIELIRFLLQEKANTAARAELIGLTSDLPQDPLMQTTAARLFQKAGDDRNALALYEQALQAQNHDTSAFTDAGATAYRLGDYGLAIRYLRRAKSLDGSAQVDQMLETAEAVVALDPSERGLNKTSRNERVLRAFQIAGERLKTCSTPAGTLSKDTAEDLLRVWTSLKRRANVRELSRNPDLRDTILDTALQIENATRSCPARSREDEALVLLGTGRSKPQQ